MSGLSDYLNSLNRDGWSTRRISREAEKHGHTINYSTVSKYLRGNHGEPKGEMLDALAAAFRVDVNDLRRAAARPAVGEPFDLGPEAARLTGPQREAIRHVVRVMLDDSSPVEHQPQRDGSTTAENIYGLAALERPSRGKTLRRQFDQLGEESQEPGTDEPA